tara:strand:- start:1527 stop:2318 length:792 start_codon:yes stop_codon:yes gene_type:complete
MKIFVIGDPHGSENIKKIPLNKADLILVTGDIGKADLARKIAFDNIDRQSKGLSKKEPSPALKKRAYMESYNSSISTIKYISKFAKTLVIFGNVESSNKETKKLSKEINQELPLLEQKLKSIKNVDVLINKKIKFQDLTIGGLGFFVDTSWVKDFKPPEYKKALKESTKQTTKIKKVLGKWKDVDILLCHYPPYGILDKVGNMAPKRWRGKNAGSKTILNYIKKKQPKYVFCGHIHEAKGKKKIGKTVVHNVGCCGDYIIIES